MKEQDISYMRQALVLSQTSRYIAPPSPWVGCLIEKDGKILSQGSTEHHGGEHAEVVAIKLAKKKQISLQNATMYITLEPCCHRGRTPPCIEAIIKSGISRVVIGTYDPDPNVRGEGVEILSRKKIDVEIGLCEDEIKNELKSYFLHRQHHKSYIILKIVQSLDGYMNCSTSPILISKQAQQDGHILRNQSQAILIGAREILRENPQLTVHYIRLQGPPPLRVVLDQDDTIPLNAHIFQTEQAPTLCITSGKRNRNSTLLEMGVDTLSWKKEDPFSCSFIQKELAHRGILQLIVEGSCISHFLQENAFNELISYIGPKILSSKSPKTEYSPPLSSLCESPPLKLSDIQKLEDTTRVTYENHSHF